MIDLGSLDTAAAANEGAEVELLNPATREPLGVFVTILGAESDAYRKLIRIESMRLQREMRKSGRNQFPLTTPEEADERRVEMLVACTKGWRTEDKDDPKNSGPFVMFGKDQLTFNAGNAHRIYSDRRWIAVQLDEAINEPTNFMQG